MNSIIKFNFPLFVVCAIAGLLAAKTETLDYLPRSPVALTYPISWGTGLKVFIFGGRDVYHDHQVCNRDIDGNTLRAIKASCLYTESNKDISAGLKEADVFLCAASYLSQIDDPTRQAITDYLSAGKGIVFSHDALWQSAWKDWPDKFKLLTGRTASSHVIQGPFTVTVAKADHPVMRGVPATFTINDELYRCQPVPHGAPTEVLATAVDDKGATYPMVWTVQYHQSRIVCMALGHNEDSHHNDNYRQILQNAVRWVVANTPATAPAPDPATAPWTTLFNGKDLTGWLYQCRPADKNLALFSVENGTIRAHAATPQEVHHDHAWMTTEGEYSDFVLRLKFQCVKGDPGNSGIQIRCRYDDQFNMEGPQLDINPPGAWRTGMLYDETRGTDRFLFPSAAISKVTAKMAPPNFLFYYADQGPGWNTMEITAIGSHIKCLLNGVIVTDYQDTAGILNDATHQKYGVGVKGHISLQMHAGMPLDMRFKDIEIQDLSLIHTAVPQSDPGAKLSTPGSNQK